MSYISLRPQSRAFLYKKIHTRVMASSQPATFLTASLTSALSCQESSAPVATSGSRCASVTLFFSIFQHPHSLDYCCSPVDSSAKSHVMLQGTYGHPFRGLTEVAQWMHLCSNKGINSYIMIDLSLASPGQGLGSFILELSI